MTVISTSLCRKPRSCTICSRKLQPSCHRKRRLEITALQQMREAPAPLAKWVQVRSSCGSQATSNTKLHYTWPKLQYHERKFIIALTIKKNTYANFLIHKAWTQIPRPNSKNFASYTHWCKHPIPQHLLVVSQSSTPPANGESPAKVNDHRFLNWQRRHSVVLNWELRYQNKNRSKQFIEHAEAKTIIPTGKRKATSKLSLSLSEHNPRCARHRICSACLICRLTLGDSSNTLANLLSDNVEHIISRITAMHKRFGQRKLSWLASS